MESTKLEPLELVPLCTARISLAKPVDLGHGPRGRRRVVDVTEAVFEGDRFRLTLLGCAAADWFVEADDGVGTLDVRLALESATGDRVYVEYGGRCDATVPLADRSLYTAPRFETGSAELRWLNLIQGVAKGRFDGPTLVYSIYELR